MRSAASEDEHTPRSSDGHYFGIEFEAVGDREEAAGQGPRDTETGKSGGSKQVLSVTHPSLIRFGKVSVIGF